MSGPCQLREITLCDHLALKMIFLDAIESQASDSYSFEQRRAWKDLVWLPGLFEKILLDGRGWVCIDREEVEAFILRFPLDRVALLYCRGRSARRGFATALLQRVQSEASQEGQPFLLTEASLLSYSLFLRNGWYFQKFNRMKFGDVFLDSYNMKKDL